MAKMKNGRKPLVYRKQLKGFEQIFKIKIMHYKLVQNLNKNNMVHENVNILCYIHVGHRK